MNSPITLALAPASATSFCSSPRRPVDDTAVQSPLRPTRRLGVARSLSSPISSSHYYAKDHQATLNKQQQQYRHHHHHQQHLGILASHQKKNNFCSLFDMLEVGWEEKSKLTKRKLSLDNIGSNNNKNNTELLAMSLAKLQFWTGIDDSSEADAERINQHYFCKDDDDDDDVEPTEVSPSVAATSATADTTTLKQETEENEEDEEVAPVATAVDNNIDDFLDLAFDRDFQDSINLESCRMERRRRPAAAAACHDVRHYSFSDMSAEQQDHLLLLEELSIEDEDDDDVDDVQSQTSTTASSVVADEHDDSGDNECDADDELSLDNTTLQTDKEYNEVHINEDDYDVDDDNKYNQAALEISMTDLVMDIAMDADFGTRDSVNLKRCHRAQARNNNLRSKQENSLY
jgi:hypothetical protein